jgi:hypothetical protein
MENGGANHYRRGPRGSEILMDNDACCKDLECPSRGDCWRFLSPTANAGPVTWGDFDRAGGRGCEAYYEFEAACARQRVLQANAAMCEEESR